jgi:hypothetical protein
MSKSDIVPLLALTLTILTYLEELRAEDWKTNDGKTYQDVKILSNDKVFVTIIDSDGGAKISIKDLPVELQVKLGFDPKAAQMQREQTNREATLKEYLRHGSGKIVQVVSGGLIVWNFATARFSDDVTKSYYTVFVSCDTTGLTEGRYFTKDVWQIGTYSYTSGAGDVTIPKFTCDEAEAYSALTSNATTPPTVNLDSNTIPLSIAVQNKYAANEGLLEMR